MSLTRKVLNWYARLSPGYGKVTPPYKHVVQIGDPGLRRASELVPVDKIKSVEIQTIIRKLEYVMKKYGSVGMSAPQIGVNFNIFCMNLTSKHLSDVGDNVVKSRGISLVPFTVFINPSMKVTDYTKVSFPEGCESVRGFSADVARFKQVEVSGYNEAGEKFSKQFSDWSARIAQHELDHLEGKLYTDVMDRRTLQCLCWEEVNLSQGRIVLPFLPK